MDAQSQIEALIPVALALLLSGLIGLDRELRARPAGIRTHMLVGMGSALTMSFATELYNPDAAARLASNVITGIGFLGAGVIVRRGTEVHELTTAASIWFTAIVGLTCGAGLYVLATGATVLGFTVLAVLRSITKYLWPDEHVVVASDRKSPSDDI